MSKLSIYIYMHKEAGSDLFQNQQNQKENYKEEK